MYAIGIITEVFEDKGTARVRFPDLDNMVSPPLPMMVPKSLNDKYSIPFDTNEHVVCIMDENMENGVILGAIYSKADTPPAAAGPGKVITAFAYGLSIESDSNTSTLSIKGTGKVKVDITGDCEVKATNIKAEATTKIDAKAPLIDIDAPIVNMTGALNVTGIVTAGGIAASAAGGGSGNVTIDGDVTVTGEVQAAEVKAGLIPLSSHKHAVTTAPGTSGVAIP